MEKHAGMTAGYSLNCGKFTKQYLLFKPLDDKFLRMFFYSDKEKGMRARD